jgi:putative aldouronate transport system permease protein
LVRAVTIKKINSSEIIFNTFITVSCALIFLVIAYPLYFIVIASISDPDYVAKGAVTLYPVGIQFDGYKRIFEDTRIWISYRNTIFYSVFGTIVNLSVTLPAAYVLSRKDFPFRRILMRYFVLTMFFSGGLVPTYLVISGLHLTNTIWVFILPFCLNVFNMIVARSFFESNIQIELLESAKLDGCSNWKFFITIALPISKALISVIFLYYFVAHWNNFFTGLIYVSENNLLPLQLILRQILLANQVFINGAGMGGDDGGFAQLIAESIKYGVIIVSTLPLLVIYPFIQKYFEKGIMIGAVKG